VIADHRVILARSWKTLVEEEHGGRAHDGRILWLRKQLEETSPDLLRVMVKDFAEALMSADADAICGAGWGERSPERVNRRNGYRERDSDTRVGSIELAVPKLREGSYFPDWLLQPRRRAEQAFVSVIADAYLAGVSHGSVDCPTGVWATRCCLTSKRDAGRN
jgi:transposase-like protein